MNKYILTCGDINGIGLEIIIKSLNEICKNPMKQFYVIAPHNAFIEALRVTRPKFKFEIIKKLKEETEKQVTVIDIGKPAISTGKPTKTSGKISFKAIETSFDLLEKDLADAVITAPISKAALDMAGIKFPGHTEMYSEWSGAKDHVMMFLSNRLNAALNSIHIPIKKVSSSITKSGLKSKIEIIINTLKTDLNIVEPKIAVLGLNPHSGEDGLIGKEEEQKIIPFIENGKFGDYLSGPFPADGYFGNKTYKEFDLTFGMYHDQVLVPFKLINFGQGVNYTAGLPIVRTSVDHGTAFNIAGKNAADPSSMLNAFKYAERIVRNRRKNVR